ncbi:MAG: phosphotransferase [Anaerolineales bacterium]
MSSPPGRSSATPIEQDARQWLRTQSKALHFRLDGELELVQQRPWSTVLRVPTDDGLLYLKSCGPRSRYEAGLTSLLSRLHPDCSPETLAFDAQHGWLLMRDAGNRLRDGIQLENAKSHWARILERYAALQIDLAGRTDQLLEIGLPDRRLLRLPELYVSLLENPVMLGVGDPDGLTGDQLERLRAFRPRLVQICSQLEAAGIPQSVNHGDFHDGNIFLQDGRYLFTDWGDASLAHPFFSLRTVFVSIENTLGIEENSPLQFELRDIYLNAWSALVPQASAREAFDLASRIWAFSSALGWFQALRNASDESRAPFAAAIPGLLDELLTANSGEYD